MTKPGPHLATLLHRLAECPAEFLLPPRTGEGAGIIHVDAVVADLMRLIGGPLPTAGEMRRLGDPTLPGGEERLRLVLVSAWLLADPWFAGRGPGLGPRMLNLLCHTLGDLATLVKAEACVTDPDRREELVRLSLRHLDLHPAGEGEREAADRLTALDSVAQRKVAREAARAERRANEIRAAMAKKRAREAATVFGRE
ncbi:MAG: hypothetical protein H7840_04115 [Alphaproteobacteria bacterium]